MVNLIFSLLLAYAAYKTLRMAWDGFSGKGIQFSHSLMVTGIGAKFLGVFALCMALFFGFLALGMLS
jgi:hypothetical protein